MVTEAGTVAPRIRVISDNDYAGDPDGLVQLAHLLVSPSVEVPLVVGSHLRPGDPFDMSASSADHAAEAAAAVVELCGRRGDVPVVAGSNTPMVDPATPVESRASEIIVTEAMRDDTDLPLYVTCGGGLTEIASAWLVEPRISERLTLVWIGGSEHDDLAEPPPAGTELEYNTAIDLVAAQVVFNDSDLSIWQVPRDVYRTVMVSWAELEMLMQPMGDLGCYLFESLDTVRHRAAGHGLSLGETYILGDSPLVLLTALQSSFQPAPASSRHHTIPCPGVLSTGLYEERPDGRPLRVYSQLDTRLLLADLWAKLARHSMKEGESS